MLKLQFVFTLPLHWSVAGAVALARNTVHRNQGATLQVQQQCHIEQCAPSGQGTEKRQTRDVWSKDEVTLRACKTHTHTHNRYMEHIVKFTAQQTNIAALLLAGSLSPGLCGGAVAAAAAVLCDDHLNNLTQNIYAF